jgi:hypothetical protein
MRKIVLALVALALVIPQRSQSNLINGACISGASSTVQLSTNTTARAKFIQIIAPAANSGIVYFGDSTTSSSKGLPIAAGGGYNTPTCDSCLYTLAAHYAYVATGDTACWAWGN